MHTDLFSRLIAWLYRALPILLVLVGFLFIFLGVWMFLYRQVSSRPIALPPDAIGSPLPTVGSKIEDSDAALVYTVKSGDSLWKISQEQLGDPFKWSALYQANKTVIGNNPDYIIPGTRLKIISSDTIKE